jgi:alkylhydroperoxidase family enzyme
MSNPLDLAWPECLVPRADAPEVKRRVRAALGFVPRTLEHTACVPWMAEIDRLANTLPVRALDAETADVGVLAAAHAAECRYCYGSARAVMLLCGYTEARIQALCGGAPDRGIPPRLCAAAELSRRVVTFEARADDLKTARSAGLRDEEIAELVMIASVTAIYARINTPLAIPPADVERAQRGFLAPLVGFFLRRSAEKRKAVWRREQSAPADIKGPFSRLLGPFLPSPAAREMRALIHACLESDLCPRRGRLLAMAVVARVADDDALRGEIRGFLSTEGIPSSTVSAAIADLDAPELYDFERALLQYAHDSVRYRPAEIQERARFLAEGRAPALVIDAIGAVAVANGLARMSILRSR